jgi:GNAT superfamily N-acetyltransferase
VIKYRWLDRSGLDKLRDLDRSESIRRGYRVREGVLEGFDVDWDVPNFEPEGQTEHSLQAQIDFCLGHLEAVGCVLGAFWDKRFVGIGVVRSQIQAGVDQLAFLHVSRDVRRQGIAREIVARLEQRAINAGAVELYVSATPSQSAVEFYQAQGFILTKDQIPELLSLEPNDIHMRKSLKSALHIRERRYSRAKSEI